MEYNKPRVGFPAAGNLFLTRRAGNLPERTVDTISGAGKARNCRKPSTKNFFLQKYHYISMKLVKKEKKMFENFIQDFEIFRPNLTLLSIYTQFLASEREVRSETSINH